MSATSEPSATALLQAWSAGDAAAREALFRLLYDDIRRLAASIRRDDEPRATLQTTALVHELYLKLVGQDQANWRNRGQFFAIAARLMRRILVDEMRHRLRRKRGGDWQRAPTEALDEIAVEAPSSRLLALDQCLDELEAVDPEATRLVELRYFCGLSLEQVAEAEGRSRPTVVRQWRSVRAWLRQRLGGLEQTA